MKKNVLTVVVLLLGLVVNAGAQEHDNVFMLGNHRNSSLNKNGSLFDFSDYPPVLSIQDQEDYQMTSTGLAVSDECGNPIFYTNGLKVRDSTLQMMPSGDSLNVHLGNYTDLGGGHFDVHGMICVPNPGNTDTYTFFSRLLKTTDSTGISVFSLLGHTVDMSLNEGKGDVISKNVPIMNGYYLINPLLAKHGNGRDWWLLSGENFSPYYYKVLLTPEGFTSQDTQQIGFKYPATDFSSVDIGSQKALAPDGSKYIDYDARNGVRIMDFDRCTGELSNYQWIEFDEFIGNGSGAAVSPNSRFLYVTGSGTVLQYDLEAEDVAASVITVGMYNRLPLAGNPIFGYCQLAPDGKIYINTANSETETLHVINNPDEKGKRCEFMPHAVQLPNTNRLVLPRYPNYRLYDLPGSPCDTLGIDGPPEFDCGN